MLLANITDDSTFHYSVQGYLRKWLCTSGDTIQYSQMGKAFNRNDASLGQTMNSAYIAVIYSQIIADTEANVEADRLTNAEYSKRYLCYAQAQARYMVGADTSSFVVGFADAPTHIYDRPSSCPSNNQTTCNSLNALYTPNANPNLPTGALVYGAGTNGDYFLDERSTTNETMVSHAYNAGITGTFAALSALVSGNSGYDQCLQGYGVLSKTIALCSDGT